MWGFWVDDQMVSVSPARLVVRHHPGRLDGARRQPLIDHPLRDHNVRRVEGRVDGGVVDVPLSTGAGAARQRAESDVGRETGVQHGWLPGHRRLRIHHRRQGLVVDVDGVDRGARQRNGPCRPPVSTVTQISPGVVIENSPTPWLNPNNNHLVERDRIRRPVVELRRLRRRMPGDPLGVLEPSRRWTDTP